MESLKIEEKIIAYLQKKLNPFVIYIFGSFATGDSRQDSDIDIAYISDQTVSHYDRFLLAQELASILNKDIDLVDLREASTVFQIQIVSKGKVIYCGDEEKRMKLEIKVYKEYAKLNEERKEILEGIQERGSVYE